MPHLIKEYAKSLGVKTSKPVVKDHFFPVLADKYITISADTNIPSKNYPYYSVVIELIKPYLNKEGIQIIQLGGETRINGVDFGLNVKFKQKGFIISNSLLHLGPDGETNHLASLKNTPVVTLFGNTLANINKPIFASSASKCINLEPKWDKKPCYKQVDPKNQISNIKAETIAQSILDLLKSKQKINFKTLHSGKAFNTKVVEIVPTSIMQISIPVDHTILIRTDYGMEEKSFLHYVKNFKTTIFSDKLIQAKALKEVGQNINNFFVFLNKDDTNIPENYFRLVKSMNINFCILCKEKNDVPILRNKYFDIAVNYAYPDEEKKKVVTKNAKFLTNKKIICDNKQYLSYAHFKKGLDSSNIVIDTPEYWRDIEHFYIYDTDKNS